MRTARLKVPEDREEGFYHCMSRVVDRRFILEEKEKEHFVGLMRECEAFCEVRVLTFCVMSNHFHVLVEVGRRPAKLPTVEEVVGKLRGLSGHQNVGAVEQRFQMYREAKDEEGEAAYLASFNARMWDVSAFMKLLKQRFTQWYNGRTGRCWVHGSLLRICSGGTGIDLVRSGNPERGDCGVWLAGICLRCGI